MLDDAQGHSQYIGFLESIRTNQAGRHLSGDYQHGYGITVGIGNPGDQIGGPGAGGGDAYAGFATGGQNRRRQRTALFVACQHMLDHRIVYQCTYRGMMQPRVAENRVDAVAVEAFPKCVVRRSWCFPYVFR